MLAEGEYVFGLDSHQPDVAVLGQACAGLAAELQGGREIHVVGRGMRWRGDAVGGKEMDRARRGPRLDGVNDDRPVEADHPLHQPQSAPVVLGNLDVSAAGQARLQLFGHPQPDAVVARPADCRGRG